MTGGGDVMAIIRQYPDSGRSYSEALAYVTPDAEVHLLPPERMDLSSRPSSLELQPTSPSPMEVRLKPFVSKEYKVLSPDDAEGLRLLPSSCREVHLVPSSDGESRVPSSVGEVSVGLASHRLSRDSSSCATRFPASQGEVVCLPISPAGSSSSQLPSDKISRETTPKPAKRSRPSSSRGSPIPSALKRLPAQDHGPPHEQLDLGRRVTLLHGEHGEVVFIPRKASPSEGLRGSLQCTSVFPTVKVCDTATPTLPDTLPRAAARESKAKALKRVRALEKLGQNTPDSLATPLAINTISDSNNKILAGPRQSYHPRPHPDVCRRESSV